MKDQHSRKPQELNEDTWYYEQKDGIEIWNCHGLLAKVSWNKIRTSLARHDKKKLPKEKSDGI